jgi:hypothetical protein
VRIGIITRSTSDTNEASDTSCETGSDRQSCLEQGVLLTLGEGVSQLWRARKGHVSEYPLDSIASAKLSTYTTLSTALPVLVPSHEDTGTTGGLGALPSETLDAALRVDLVVLEDGHLDLLPLVLDLLGGGVVLLLPLLGTSSETQDEVEGGLLLDVCYVGRTDADDEQEKRGKRDERKTSAYCSPKGSCRPPTAYQRRSIAAGHYGCASREEP